MQLKATQRLYLLIYNHELHKYGRRVEFLDVGLKKFIVWSWSYVWEWGFQSKELQDLF
jgi:hypothetical protein